ncbi:MAG TPA: XRE family transcriptional regulator [Acidimicrobiales bacterium]
MTASEVPGERTALESRERPARTVGARPSSPVKAEESSDPANSASLGPRLRARREEMGFSLRQFARDLNVSASFISQLETGKTQPSVATLYAICTALNMTIDDVFDEVLASDDSPIAAASARRRSARIPHSPVVSPGHRRSIKLESGVTWERLTSATNPDFDFVFVRYDVGGSSNSDGRLIRHVGTECGYVIRGALEVTLGFETFTMQAGDAISFDSSTPHRLANVGDVPVEAIWFDEGGHNRQP